MKLALDSKADLMEIGRAARNETLMRGPVLSTVDKTGEMPHRTQQAIAKEAGVGRPSKEKSLSAPDTDFQAPKHSTQQARHRRP